MCFSATASFVGAGVIGAAGVATLTLVRQPRELPFAALPLLFAVHQALEGVTWLALDGRTDADLTGWGVHAWVMIAWAVLPAYVPWAVWLMEQHPLRRRLLSVTSVVGLALSGYMVYLAVQPAVAVSDDSGNLDYHLGVPFSAALLAVPYVFATCFGPMFSSRGWVVALGVGNLVAMTIAALLKAADYASIWCTLAAFLSLIVFAHFASSRWNDHHRPTPVRSGAASPA